MKLKVMEDYVKELEEVYKWHVDCMIETNHVIKEFRKRINKRKKALNYD